MGQSTDAYLFYGLHWDEETTKPWEIGRDPDDIGTVDLPDVPDEDWEKRFARAFGIKEPTVAYPLREVKRTRENGYNSTPTDYTPEEQAAIDARCAYWKAVRDCAASSACVVDTHCSGEYPLPFVAIRASYLSASRGDPLEVTSLAVDPTWDESIEAFCKLMGIPQGDQKPRWWLCSNWN